MECTYLHGMQLGVWWLAFRKLDGCYPQTPDIRLMIVATLLYDLRGHPVRSAHKCVLLC